MWVGSVVSQRDDPFISGDMGWMVWAGGAWFCALLDCGSDVAGRGGGNAIPDGGEYHIWIGVGRIMGDCNGLEGNDCSDWRLVSGWDGMGESVRLSNGSGERGTVPDFDLWVVIGDGLLAFVECIGSGWSGEM